MISVDQIQKVAFLDLEWVNLRSKTKRMKLWNTKQLLGTRIKVTLQNRLISENIQFFDYLFNWTPGNSKKRSAATSWFPNFICWSSIALTGVSSCNFRPGNKTIQVRHWCSEATNNVAKLVYVSRAFSVPCLKSTSHKKLVVRWTVYSE